ncbi:nucleoprotein [Cryptosporidium bovis]|uniref:nucleoprotein n=1 Tax=Cryptosporidium bovis TaxID=310047 RepID=UPI00351A08C5|nr:nucleoprotein [Cryptosporidium bovis]
MKGRSVLLSSDSENNELESEDGFLIDSGSDSELDELELDMNSGSFIDPEIKSMNPKKEKGIKSKEVIKKNKKVSNVKLSESEIYSELEGNGYSEKDKEINDADEIYGDEDDSEYEDGEMNDDDNDEMEDGEIGEEEEEMEEGEMRDDIDLNIKGGENGTVGPFGLRVTGEDLETIKSRVETIIDYLDSKQGNMILDIRGAGGKRLTSRSELMLKLVDDISLLYGYNLELTHYILNLFSPKEALQFFEANETKRPLTIRTNMLKSRRRDLAQRLISRGANVDPIGEWSKVGLTVYSSSVPIGATPEYLAGHYMIQSASSLIPVMALAPQPGEKILDMAAAPGGKTTYIGQLMKNMGVLYANDLRKDRCTALIANLHRMGINNSIVTSMDGRELAPFLPKLDRVLLDAPCTGLGIIARDPSVKVKRSVKELSQHSLLQKELLKAAIDMVDANSKTGGYIVYSTCSVSIEENEMVMDYILKTRNVKLVPLGIEIGSNGISKFREYRFNPTISIYTRRIYPHLNNMDGFFIAKLKKVSNDIPTLAKKDRNKSNKYIKTWGKEKWTHDLTNVIDDYDNSQLDNNEGNNNISSDENDSDKRKKTVRKRDFNTDIGSSNIRESNIKKPRNKPGKRDRAFFRLQKEIRSSSDNNVEDMQVSNKKANFKYN